MAQAALEAMQGQQEIPETTEAQAIRGTMERAALAVLPVEQETPATPEPQATPVLVVAAAVVVVVEPTISLAHQEE